MHILFSPRVAGSERYCIDLANGQAAQGHEVHVAGSHNAPLAEKLSDRVTFHGFRTPFFRSLRLGRLFSQMSIDICHAHLSHACKALSRTSQDMCKVATLHVGYKAHQHARMHGLILVNTAQTARLKGYSGYTEMISNWMPVFEETPCIDLKRELSLSPDTLLIGAVGRLHKSKGYDLLIKSYRQIECEKSALIIVGDGPEKLRLERLAKGDSRIHLLGYSDNVSAFLRNFDLFVSPSRVESFGLAILEAMHHGLPIISTLTDGPRDYLRNYSVRLVEPDNVNALTSALTEAVKERAIGTASPPFYDLSIFSRDNAIARIDAFYSHILKQLEWHKGWK